MINIARFNKPYYIVAIVVLIPALVGLLLLHGLLVKSFCSVVLAGAFWFLFGSLSVAHYIYDSSDLYRWGWLDRALNGSNIHQAIFCHAGFDETSAELHKKFGAVEWQILDHFEANRMTEASLLRARSIFPPTTGTLASPYDLWPVAAKWADVVFGILAIHELRSKAERSAWFTECKRCLRKGGRLILVEHVRDAANFIAFGPGFLHFHSLRNWRRGWEDAGFHHIDEFRLTPFVRVFVLIAP